MKIAQISLLMMMIAVVIVSGCKAAQQPVTAEQTSEQAVEDGLQELEEIDSLEEDTNLELEEIEKMELE